MNTSSLKNTLLSVFNGRRTPAANIELVDDRDMHRALQPWDAMCLHFKAYRIDDLAMVSPIDLGKPSPIFQMDIQQLADDASRDGYLVTRSSLMTPAKWITDFPNSEPLYAKWQALEVLLRSQKEGAKKPGPAAILALEGACPDWFIFYQDSSPAMAIQVPSDTERPCSILSTWNTVAAARRLAISLHQAG